MVVDRFEEYRGKVGIRFWLTDDIYGTRMDKVLWEGSVGDCFLTVTDKDLVFNFTNPGKVIAGFVGERFNEFRWYRV